MAALSIAITLAMRIALVLLFFPFSALDKIFNFHGALSQAGEAVSSRTVAAALVFAGLFVEIVMPLGIVTGIADRLCAFILAGYCGVTALLWKQFWKPGDFWASANGKGRTLFWDFLKNLALGAGFLLITFGTDASSVMRFIAHPTWSSDPYGIAQQQAQP